jgi:N-acetylglucosamine-6-sulfatase
MKQGILSSHRLRWAVALLAALSVATGALAATHSRHSQARAQTPTAIAPSAGAAAGQAAARRPNIVFVLTDDLSNNLLPYMPHVQALRREGLTFGNYFVSDSLCCPSRSSILTGNFPHDTGVFSNVGPDGGFHLFHARGEERDTFAVALRRAGYRTALMGKYLNGYMGAAGAATTVPDTYVPPGWSEWDVAGNGYPEFDYTLNDNGVLRSYGHAPADYMTDVLAGEATGFISRAADAGKPFFLEVATFAPHYPYVPAPRDAEGFPGLRAPRPPSFDVLPSDAPGWLKHRAPLSAEQIIQIDRAFRHRVQMVQAVDGMIGELEQAIADHQLSANTYIVFSSDNGLHTGEYRLMPGKLTAFDTDIRVPLVVKGPGVPAGAETGELAENIDLAPTFAALARTKFSADGHPLTRLLHGEPVADWRNAILVEHHGADLRGIDPDFQQPPSGNPRTYEAMRTRRFMYVEYRNGEREFYDLTRDPFELDNLAAQLSRARLGRLHADLKLLEECHGAQACWDAMHAKRSA